MDLLTLPCYGYSQGFIDTTLWAVSLADVDILTLLFINVNSFIYIYLFL